MMVQMFLTGNQEIVDKQAQRELLKELRELRKAARVGTPDELADFRGQYEAMKESHEAQDKEITELKRQLAMLVQDPTPTPPADAAKE